MYCIMRPHRVDDSVLGVRFAIDYSQADIVTRSFEWSLAFFHRKDVVKLRKLLYVLPSKISMLHNRRNLSIVSPLIYSLHACVKRFQILAQGVRPVEEVRYNLDQIALINLSGAAPFPVSKKLTVADGILELCSKIIRLARTDRSDEAFWRRAEILTCYADLLREGCELYLDFVYRVLVSRGAEDVHNDKSRFATSSLQDRRSCVRREMFRLRDFAREWTSGN